MSKVLAICFVLLAGFSCDKSNSGTINSLSFGTAHGMCAGDCAIFFKIEGDKIYPDSSLRYSDFGSLVFAATPLSNEKYLLAKELKDSFPVYLLKNVNQTIGCPDCADQGGIHIEVRQNETVKFWHIDTDTSKQPVEIRRYIERLRTIISQL